MSAQPYSLDDLHVDLFDLHQLLVAAYGVIHEMPYERNGERDHDLDQVASLLRIARDYAERISSATDTPGDIRERLVRRCAKRVVS